MIIPVKCFTCGKVLADKYRYFKREVKMRKNMDDNDNDVIYLTKLNNNKTIEGVVMDELNLNKMCCRRHFITHVDIE
jgi:DNA-directed RNA polymerase subunit N (RpoN/RPB10)